MIEFEVKSKTQPIGKRKGQTVYFAQPVSQQHLTNKMVVDRIVRETSLSAGDVSNALISLGAIVRDAFEFEERNNIWNTPYLFNAKEFDEETGLYYYGARYYDPKVSLWISPDPIQEKYPNTSTYCYTHNNPIVYHDPNGKDAILIVYPDYSINICNTPEINIPYIGKIPKQKINIDSVGHAGVLLINITRSKLDFN